jgi:hypothetical protein
MKIRVTFCSRQHDMYNEGRFQSRSVAKSDTNCTVPALFLHRFSNNQQKSGSQFAPGV